jgi:hypothetical protein
MVKRGIRLMKRYKIVSGHRNIIGLSLEVPEDSIIWTVVSAGYLATSQCNRVMGIAERKKQLETALV